LKEEEMACAEQQRLLNDEGNAWAAYKALDDSGSNDQEELARRLKNAGDASARLNRRALTPPIPLRGTIS
jgi:hypothetical protein